MGVPPAGGLSRGASRLSPNPKSGQTRRMARLAAELLLLAGLLILTLHITVSWSGPFKYANVTSNSNQNSLHIADNFNEDSLSSQVSSEQWDAIQATGGNIDQQTDKPRVFLLDLHNFPDLSKADINKQNPNIQVTIEVLNGPEGVEPEKEQHKEKNPNRAFPNWWTRSTGRWPGSPHSKSHGTDQGNSNSIRLPADGERYDDGGGQRHHLKGKAQEEFDYMDGEGIWSGWSPCSVSCGDGNQKRTRSCGYACTATESRTCDMLSCPATDSCERWMNCKSEFLRKYMIKVANDLPSCPCSYPTEAAYGSTSIRDAATRRVFRWKDASSPKEKLEIYKPTARYCIRSSLTLESTTLAAQHCCYDDRMALITRGNGAGSPNLISTEFSEDLHYKVDILPWVICKGDWSRYNQARPPNNGQRCSENPMDKDFNKQHEEARDF